MRSCSAAGNLALAGLEALHAQNVPGGDLTADCLLLAPVGKGNQRTIKILHAGLKRQLFDETAIGRSIKIQVGGASDLELSSSSTFRLTGAGAIDPPGDIFRLGCILYRCVTGIAPFAPNDQLHPARPARPVSELAPDVPEMLSQIIEEMIDPDPAKRPQKAGNVAKALRVFLAAEESARDVKEEEQVVNPMDRPSIAAARAAEVEDDSDDEEGEEETATAPRRSARIAALARQGGDWHKALAIWQEIKPDNRDWLFLAGGAVATFLIILLVEILTGIRLMYVAGLVTGAAVSYFVDIFVRWRKQKTEGVEQELAQ
jgi:serine/threonine protein kinase